MEYLQREVETLQVESSSLREQLETQKEIGESRSRKQGQQLKGQLWV